MTAVVPALAGSLIVAGLLGVVLGARPVPPQPAAPGRSHPSIIARAAATSGRTRTLFLTGLGAGALAAVLTGWVIAVILLPAAAVGIPALLSSAPATTEIGRLEAMEEWTRSLAGVLTAGVGLEQALIATVRSTPETIGPEVTRLVARLHARWPTEAALRAFADDLDDATGDLVAAHLILSARRRGAGLAGVLEALAQSVAEDVRARRQVEADRAKPRATARWITLITVAVLGFLALTGRYIAPFGTPVGQVILLVLLAAYVGVLVWMKTMTRGKPLPRFIGSDLGGQA
ncbi:type II secretion system F family protein [Segeticoccus rhizosphaerae]|uniref:type II secretion system F family protein n=1 Tax=Segeticoccus rhizosphaerae TaxID=1104777 RepID=UPI0010C06BCF|nr:type II secretion system F family protein [Ornithinicoccus soli]